MVSFRLSGLEEKVSLRTLWITQKPNHFEAFEKPGLSITGHRAEGKGQRAEGKGQRAWGRGQGAEGKGQRAEGKGQRARGIEQGA